MAILPLQLARVSNQLRTSIAQSQLAKTQQQLIEVQNQLATGNRINTPSDDPGNAAIVQQLQKTLEKAEAYSANIAQAKSSLGNMDATLADVSDLLLQAQTLASANVGSDVTPEARINAASIVDSLYSQALSLANKQFNGVYVFGGDKSTKAPYTGQAGGVQFVGSTQVLSNAYDDNTQMPFMVNGGQVFGAMSARAAGAKNLNPDVSATARLIDLNGALGNGIQPGAIQVSNGAITRTVDLSNAASIGDVINTINSANVGGITAGINAAGNGLTLTAGAGDNILVTDPGGGSTAADLGILHKTASGNGISVVGADVTAKVTPLTKLVDLRGGAGIDPAGFKITNGTVSATIDLSTITTVEGLLNAVNGANLGVRAQINADGSGIDILNTTQGTEMSISEVGGTTASQLGVRTFSPSDALTDLNNGKGLTLGSGADLTITRTDGSSFQVDLNGAQTAQDAIDAINAADAGGGITASFATNGNGLILTDATSGAGALSVANANGSNVVKELGLDSAPISGQIVGKDVNPVVVGGVFANLAKLAQSLRSSDTAGITSAAQALKSDYDQTVLVRGQTGARVQELESRANRLDDQNLATQALLSSLKEVDFTTAITQFQGLQNALQAGLQTTASILNLSLLDYLK